MAQRLWDISQTLRPSLPIWPGDTAFASGRRWTQGEDASPVTVSYFTTTVHAGAHADAPLHYDPAGADSATTRLEAYVGRCQVVDARAAGAVIEADFINARLTAPPPRVLLRTFERFPTDAWPARFTTLAPAAIEALARLGVILVGIDSPSLDPETSKTMDAHRAVRAADMRVLEGLVLDDVPEGEYDLIALPLKLAGLDASPVRAVLRSLDL